VTVEPFHIAVPDEVLDDLAARLARSRTPPRFDGPESGTTERIAELIGHWRTGYDWRAHERRLNAVPQHRAVVDGVGIHFIHVRGAGPDPMPLLLTNGWPSSFVEYLGVLDLLTDPAAHGGDPADAFTVVVPALPGYGLSDRCLGRALDREAIAALFDRLMVEHLGYGSYVAHGDDIGGGVVNRLGIHHPGTVRAIQTTNWLNLGEAGIPEEEPYHAAERRWERTRGAYAHVQATRPQTLAYALDDSPAGLAAWILEKFLTWTDPATRDDLPVDDLITNVMLYWATRTIGTSIRLYAPAPPPKDVVSVPASVLLTREPELPDPPESYLHRAYPSLYRVARTEQGGHFLAMESPSTFAAEVREAFRPFRVNAQGGLREHRPGVPR
jgi:pimeloyl-ACP methyl ester carboxylesterase